MVFVVEGSMDERVVTIAFESLLGELRSQAELISIPTGFRGLGFGANRSQRAIGSPQLP